MPDLRLERKRHPSVHAAASHVIFYRLLPAPVEGVLGRGCIRWDVLCSEFVVAKCGGVLGGNLCVCCC